MLFFSLTEHFSAFSPTTSSHGQHRHGNSTTMAPKRALKGGVYAPTMTFFDQNEELDLPTIKKHSARLAKAGLVGLVTMGSNGEAVHLSNEEKIAVTKAKINR